MGFRTQWLKRTAADAWLRTRNSASSKRASLIAGIVIGALILTAGGAMAMKAVTTQIADAAVARLSGGEDPQAVLDAVADRVVDQLTGRNGVLREAGDSVAQHLGKAASDKLASIDTGSLLDDVSAEVIRAGMSKLDQISTQAIISEVTETLIAQAVAKIDAIDLEALAKITLNGAADELLESVDLEQIVKDEVAKIDLNAIVSHVVQEQLGSSGGSSTFWSRLFRR